jgi:hypothetical protein
MIDTAIENNIILFCLPPHTTHRLQPCDVGAFGPLKKAWNYQCDSILEETGDQMKAKDVVKHYMIARRAAFKEDTIKKAWTRSGIGVDETGTRPQCNPGRFTDEDFAPSVSTSTQLDLPDGFPGDPDALERESSSSDDGSDDESDPDSSGNNPDKGSSDESTDDSSSDSGDSNSGWRNVASSVPGRFRRPTVDTNSRHDNRTQTTPPNPPDSLPPLRTQFNDPLSDEEVIDSDWSDGELARYYKAKVERYRSQRDEAREQRGEVTTHAILAGRHIHYLQSKLNAKNDKKGNDRVVNIGSRITSTQEGRAEAARQKAAREEKAKKADENQQKKARAQVEVSTRRADLGRDGMVFTGPVGTQKLGILKDIAWSLGISEDGTRDTLISRINLYFDDDENNQLRTDNRYIGLFSKRATKRPMPSTSNLVPTSPGASPASPPRQRRRLADATNSPPRLPSSQVLTGGPVHIPGYSICILFYLTSIRFIKVLCFDKHHSTRSSTHTRRRPQQPSRISVNTLNMRQQPVPRQSQTTTLMHTRHGIHRHALTDITRL